MVAKGGMCSEPPAPCGGGANVGCPADKICELDSCGVDALGVCLAAPPAGDCAAGGTPQCGCDSLTYTSTCARQKAGVALKHVGACNPDPNAVGCKLGPVKPILCPSNDHYCQIEIAGACEGKGVCVLKPKGCEKIYKPVCGCDQTTYGNACMASSAGWNVAKNDPCP